MNKIDFLGYPLAVSPFPVVINKKRKITINTINQYSFCVAERDAIYRETLKSSSILLPDGIGVVKACEFITGKLVTKIAGAEMHQHLLVELNKQKGKCFYLGSSQETLNKIKLKIKNNFPAIDFNCYSPPFKGTFCENDISIMAETINNFKPDIVFIGLTAPKQEKLSSHLKEKIDVSIICSIGAVFDFYAGTITRPSQFWIDLNLEWFIRLVKEPKRMWKRYIYFGFVFAYDITLAKFKKETMREIKIK